MSNEEVVNYFVTRIPYKRHLKDLCEDLADYCCHKVSLRPYTFTEQILRKMSDFYPVFRAQKTIFR